MEAFCLLMHGFAVLLTWKTLLLMMVGLVLGIFVAVLLITFLAPMISSFALKFGPPRSRAKHSAFAGTTRIVPAT